MENRESRNSHCRSVSYSWKKSKFASTDERVVTDRREDESPPPLVDGDVMLFLVRARRSTMASAKSMSSPTHVSPVSRFV